MAGLRKAIEEGKLESFELIFTSVRGEKYHL